MSFFRRDVMVLLAVSILLGTLAAKTVSYGANIYFQQTLVSLVGDYGEYDLIVQIREESRDEGRAQLVKTLDDALPGAAYKEGPAIIGKANFFVALPKDRKNKAIYESLDRIFSGVPGVSGVSIITEPRINLRGVPVGAAEGLERELQEIAGVDFVYKSGASVGVVLGGVDRVAEVTSAVEAALARNKIIDITFPVGAEPENPVMLAETITGEIYRQLNPSVARYVSVNTEDGEMVHLIATLTEIRRYLNTYATKVQVKPSPAAKLSPGDTVALQGTEIAPLKEGDETKRGNALVLLTETRKDGTFSGTITQGDAADLKNLEVWRVEEGRVGAPAGMASYRNPREDLVAALVKTAGLMEQMPLIVTEGSEIGKTAIDALGSYGENAEAVKRTIRHIDSAVDSMESAAGQLERLNVGGLKSQLDQSSKSMTGLLSALRLVKMFNPDVTTAISNLEVTQQKIAGFSNLLGGMDDVTAQAVEARTILRSLTDESNAIVKALQSFEGDQVKENLAYANRKLTEFEKMDFAGIARQLRSLADNAPKLSDGEMYQSVQLLDKVIEGQAIPGKKLQIMIDRGAPFEIVKPIVYSALGHQGAGVFESDVGVIEPNIYLQVYEVLGEVQSVLAGMAAIVMTFVLLALDHTAVMSALKRRRLQTRLRGGSARLGERVKNAVIALFYKENVYGMAVGAVLLSAIFLLSGGGIPYMPWYAAPPTGAAIGLFMAWITERITPVSVDEVLAAQSLGMSFDEILREIVIPAGRPGLMQRINRARQKFK